MKKNILYSFMLVSCMNIAFAQSTADKVNKTNSEVNTTKSSVETSAQTATAVKSSLEGLFKKKGTKSDNKTTITVTGLDEYDNEHLASLKSNLKSAKGVKDVDMEYNNGTAMFKIAYKGGAMDLWDLIPKEVRQHFSMQEANENTINLQYKSQTVQIPATASP